MTTMDTLLHLSKDDMDKVNNLITTHMQSDVSLIPQLAGYLITAEGKRIRPILICMVARMCNMDIDTPQIPLYATCVEFIHTATLLHDDVIDESDMRRGQQSAHKVWGNQATVLVGDFLFSRAFDLMANTDNTSATKILSDASCRLAEGEILQLMTSHNLDTTETMYLDMIKAKTAVLFAAACKVGGVISQQNDKVCSTLYTYGESLGVAFQMIDDALDYQSNDTVLGKNTGDDFKEGKITLPVLYVMQNATHEETKFLNRTFVDGDYQEDDFLYMLSLIEKYNAIPHTLDTARKYGDIAKQNLDMIGFNNPYKDALVEIVDYIINRNH